MTETEKTHNRATMSVSLVFTEFLLTGKMRLENVIIAYLEEQTEADPLVVLMIAPFIGIQGLVDTRVGHIEPDPLPEGAWNCVGGMDPAVGIKHLFRNIFGMNTVYGVAHVLLRRYDE